VATTGLTLSRIVHYHTSMSINRPSYRRRPSTEHVDQNSLTNPQLDATRRPPRRTPTASWPHRSRGRAVVPSQPWLTATNFVWLAFNRCKKTDSQNSDCQSRFPLLSTSPFIRNSLSSRRIWGFLRSRYINFLIIIVHVCCSLTCILIST